MHGHDFVDDVALVVTIADGFEFAIVSTTL